MIKHQHSDISDEQNIKYQIFDDQIFFFQWHSEGFDLPQNAEIVATNNTFKVQAFCLKDNIYGFQFHPEVIESMILSWNIKSAHMLNKSGATSTKNQLEEHKKYSDSVKVWFIGFLKSWIGIN